MSVVLSCSACLSLSDLSHLNRLRQPEASFTVCCFSVSAWLPPLPFDSLLDHTVQGKSVSLLQRQTSFLRKLWALICSCTQLK